MSHEILTPPQLGERASQSRTQIGLRTKILDRISSDDHQKVFIEIHATSDLRIPRQWFGYLEMELEAHIWRTSRVHEYYSPTKYERLTPSLNTRTAIVIFLSSKARWANTVTTHQYTVYITNSTPKPMLFLGAISFATQVLRFYLHNIHIIPNMQKIRFFIKIVF